MIETKVRTFDPGFPFIALTGGVMLCLLMVL